MEVDLHIHTMESDGTYTPEDIIKRAKEKGLKAIAITDHDTVAGLKRAREIAKKLKFEFIDGIELSCNSQEGLEVHILGYYLNIEDKIFLKELEKLDKKREERNLKIMEKLRENGVDIDENQLKNMATGNILSRLHFANYLLEKGIVGNRNEAFERYLGKTGVAYVEKDDFPPEKAVEILKKNGAFVSLAHPKLISNNDEKVEKLMIRLKELGLDGIEAQYSSFTKSERKKYKKLAKKYDLLITGGSDFHGGNRENIDLGCGGIEYEQLKKIKNKLKKER